MTFKRKILNMYYVFIYFRSLPNEIKEEQRKCFVIVIVGEALIATLKMSFSCSCRLMHAC